MAESFTEHPFRDLPGDGSGSSAALFARASGDEGAEPAFHVDHSLPLERPVGVLDGIGVDLQFVRQLSGRRQWFIRLQNSNRDAASDLVGNLAVNRPRVGRIYVN